MKIKRFFLGVFLLFLALPFILASPAASINLAFQDNSDATYDEGVFTVTWESGGGETEIGYNVHIFSDEVFLMVAPNTSNTGYDVNNPSEAKYTFIVEALNGTNHGTNSSGNISINVDSTSPSLNVVSAENNVFKKNTDTIYVNAFVSDSNSGVGDCVVSVGGVNTSITSSGGWCNSTSISLSGVSDGNKTINVYAKDVAGNVAINKVYRILIDSSGPSISFECLPPNVNPNEEVTCNCTVTDVGVGVNDTGIQFSEHPSTSNVGTFERTCTAYDLLGNSNSETASYTVASGTLYQGEDTNYSEDTSWIYTYSINNTDFLMGYTETLALKRKIEFPLGSETHSVGVLEVNISYVKLEIASTPIEKILEIGEEFKVDLSSDGFYDIYIVLNGILNNNSANLSIRGIHESVSGIVSGLDDGNETGLNSSDNQTGLGKEGGFLKDMPNKRKIMLIGGIVLFLIIVAVLAFLLFRKKGEKDSKTDEENSLSSNDSEDTEFSDDSTDTSTASSSTEQVSEVSSNDSGLSGTSREPGKSSASVDDIVKSHPDPTATPKTGQA